jgi:hypothetical protein
VSARVLPSPTPGRRITWNCWPIGPRPSSSKQWWSNSFWLRAFVGVVIAFTNGISPSPNATLIAFRAPLRGQHPNSRANLVPGVGAWQPGATPRVTNGLRTRRPSAETLAPIIEEIEAGLPIKGTNGGVPFADRLAVEMCAVQVLVVRRCRAYLELHGDEDSRGNQRPEVEGLAKAAERAAKMLDRLGMTPTSRAKLGVDLARMQDASVDLATAMSEADPDIRRQLLQRVPGWQREGESDVS